jgi:hypothetical protein
MANRYETDAGIVYVASGEYGMQRDINKALGEARGNIARTSLAYERGRCLGEEACKMAVTHTYDDSGNISSSTFKCDEAQEGCEVRVALAAERAEIVTISVLVNAREAVCRAVEAGKHAARTRPS